MKILLSTVYPIVSGSTRVLFAAARALRQDHDVVVRAPLPDADERLVWYFPPDSIETPWEKARILPHVVGRAIGEARALRGRGFDAIYVHDEPSLYVYGLAARLIGIPLVRHVHMRAQGVLEGIRAALATHVIHISEHARGAAKGAIVRNPLRPLQVERRPVPGELVVAGSISGRKNQILAVETLAALHQQGMNVRLRLCGDVIESRYADETLARAKALGVAPHVTLEGPVPTERYLSSASCMLMTSHYENQPLALLEAIAAEVPVVASDIPAHRELVALRCLDPQALRPLRAAEFAEGVIASGPAAGGYAERVRAMFSEARFGVELRAFFDSVRRERAGLRAA